MTLAAADSEHAELLRFSGRALGSRLKLFVSAPAASGTELPTSTEGAGSGSGLAAWADDLGSLGGLAAAADDLGAFHGLSVSIAEPGARARLAAPVGRVERSAPPTAAGLQASAEAAWDAVVAEFAAVDLALSRFREDSELTALNRLAGSGGVALVSWRLRMMLATVHRAGRLTGGRFDATVIDALERLGEHGAAAARASEGAGPSGDPVEVEIVPRETPGASLVQIPDVPLDSGGIGKGLALRWAAKAAIRHLPDGAGLLLDAGGDIVCAGDPPPEGWLIGVEDPVAPPDQDADPLAACALTNGGVSTSSVAVRNWIAPDGRHVHHLVDPVSREPARTGLIAVTVAGPDPAWNEVWSKALFLGGSESIGEEARRRGLAAWWVDERGRLGMTPEARVRSPWVEESRVG